LKKAVFASTDLRSRVVDALGEVSLADEVKRVSGVALSSGDDEVLRLQYRIFGGGSYSAICSAQLDMLASVSKRLKSAGFTVTHEASAERPWIFVVDPAVHVRADNKEHKVALLT